MRSDARMQNPPMRVFNLPRIFDNPKDLKSLTNSARRISTAHADFAAALFAGTSRHPCAGYRRSRTLVPYYIGNQRIQPDTGSRVHLVTRDSAFGNGRLVQF